MSTQTSAGSHVRVLPLRDELPVHSLQRAIHRLRTAKQEVAKAQADFDAAWSAVERDCSDLRGLPLPLDAPLPEPESYGA